MTDDVFITSTNEEAFISVNYSGDIYITGIEG